MRAISFWRFAGTIALVSAASESVAQGSTMTTGVAPAAVPNSAGSVPDIQLRPPVAQPGGWGPNGWQGSAPPPSGAAPGAPAPPAQGGSNLPPSGGMVTATPDRPAPSDGRWAGRYPRVAPGSRLPKPWLSANYYVGDWWLYGLYQPGFGQQWLRYYDDALLTDARGQVADARYGIDWDRRGPSYGGGAYGGVTYEESDRVVDTGNGQVHIHTASDGSQVITIENKPTPGRTTTTTTTYYDDNNEVVVRRGGSAPRRR
jgi:hypothetical protein